MTDRERIARDAKRYASGVWSIEAQPYVEECFLAGAESEAAHWAERVKGLVEAAQNMVDALNWYSDDTYDREYPDESVRDLAEALATFRSSLVEPLQNAPKCKDCEVKTKPGPGSARCSECWEDRCGHEQTDAPKGGG